MAGLFNLTRRHEQRALWGSVSWPEVANFIGPNADRFEGTWLLLSSRAGAGRSPMAHSWSWPAFFAPWVWLFYRKQWALGATILLAPAVLRLVFPGASGGGTLGLYLLFAMQAKAHYVSSAVRKIANLKHRSEQKVDLSDTIKYAGGVSMIAGAVSLVGLAMICALSAAERFYSINNPGPLYPHA